MKTNTKIIEQIMWKCARKYLKQWFKKTKCKRHTVQSLMFQQSLMGTEQLRMNCKQRRCFCYCRKYSLNSECFLKFLNLPTMHIDGRKEEKWDMCNTKVTRLMHKTWKHLFFKARGKSTSKHMLNSSIYWK